jgi:hypothetical protein
MAHVTPAVSAATMTRVAPDAKAAPNSRHAASDRRSVSQWRLPSTKGSVSVGSVATGSSAAPWSVASGAPSSWMSSWMTPSIQSVKRPGGPTRRAHQLPKPSR